jgi:hypothetical protein
VFIGAGASACIGCLQGTFASSSGSTLCWKCPLGTYSANAAATGCTPCWSEAAGPCQSVTARKCTPCNSLRFFADPLGTEDKYRCKFGNSTLSAEFVCTIPDPDIRQKFSCDYEDSLSCTVQPYPGSSSSGTRIELICQPSTRYLSNLP